MLWSLTVVVLQDNSS